MKEPSLGKEFLYDPAVLQEFFFNKGYHLII